MPSPLYDADAALASRSAARILLKREDLNHTGAHKIRNVLGQALLTKRMGKTRVIAETGAGQHGVASATAAAYFGLDCTVYMGAVDTKRQALNVARMQLLGAKVVPVDSGSATLKDAINEALRDWVASVDHTAYLFGTAAGPHPFPSMVRDFTRGIGDEARAQCLELYGVLPRRASRPASAAGPTRSGCSPRSSTTDVADLRLRGRAATASRPAGTRRRSRPATSGVLHGARTYVLQDEDGQTIESHSISAGLDYPGVGPQHAHLAATGRATYRPVTDAEAMDAMALLAAHRGDHPGHRVRPRDRRRARGGRGARPRRHHAGQPLRPRRQGHGHRASSGSASATPTARRSRRVSVARPPSRRPAPRAAPPWSATCRPASPTSTARSRRCRRWSTPAAT